MIKILFVCKANINRSVMAHAISNEYIKKYKLEDKIYVDSAGFSNVHLGERPYFGTKRILRKNKISYEGIVSRKVTKDDFDSFDYILAMDQDVLSRLHSLNNGGKSAIHLLLDFYENEPNKDIPDPSITQKYSEVYETIHTGCGLFLDRLKDKENL